MAGAEVRTASCFVGRRDPGGIRGVFPGLTARGRADLQMVRGPDSLVSHSGLNRSAPAVRSHGHCPHYLLDDFHEREET